MYRQGSMSATRHLINCSYQHRKLMLHSVLLLDNNIQEDSYMELSCQGLGSRIHLSMPRHLSFHRWGNSLLSDMDCKRHHSNTDLQCSYCYRRYCWQKINCYGHHPLPLVVVPWKITDNVELSIKFRTASRYCFAIWKRISCPNKVNLKANRMLLNSLSQGFLFSFCQFLWEINRHVFQSRHNTTEGCGCWESRICTWIDAVRSLSSHSCSWVDGFAQVRQFLQAPDPRWYPHTQSCCEL